MRLILFDIDGTLLWTAGAGRRAIHRAMLDEVGTAGPIDGYRFDGKTDPQIVRELLTLAGHPEASPEDRLTAVLGVKDLVVVTTPDAVLVLPRSRAEEVKEIVAELKALGRTEASSHRRVHRPWGHYEGVDAGERFQVKRIVVAPGSTLSLQRHMHRA